MPTNRCKNPVTIQEWASYPSHFLGGKVRIRWPPYTLQIFSKCFTSVCGVATLATIHRRIYTDLDTGQVEQNRTVKKIVILVLFGDLHE